MKVRAGRVYRFNPNLLDLMHPCCSAETGAQVRVINLPSAPKCNTMGQCHVEALDGTFLGMCSTNSLSAVV